MASGQMPQETGSITSSILHKQDLFWETIIAEYKATISELKVEDNELQNYLFELKILIQAIATFNLMKLLNQNGDTSMVSQLLQLKCICPKDVPKEEPIKVHVSFHMNQNDINQMTRVKELVNRERDLIDEVNVLRIKDMTLTQLKLSMDNMMKQHFPDMLFSSSDEVSEIPHKIQESVKEVRVLRNELRELEKENRRLEEKLHDAIPNELLRAQKHNRSIEDETAEMKQKLEDLLSGDHETIMKNIIKKHCCSLNQLSRMVQLMQHDADVLKESIELMKKFE